MDAIIVCMDLLQKQTMWVCNLKSYTDVWLCTDLVFCQSYISSMYKYEKCFLKTNKNLKINGTLQKFAWFQRILVRHLISPDNWRAFWGNWQLCIEPEFNNSINKSINAITEGTKSSLSVTFLVFCFQKVLIGMLKCLENG